MADIFDRFTELGLCQICALPLPRTVAEGVCSRRCAGLRKTSGKILGVDQSAWRGKILDVLKALKKGTTICPGELSTRLLPDLEKPLTVFRPLLYQLNEDGKVVLSQKNVTVPWWKIRGPFRIRC